MPKQIIKVGNELTSTFPMLDHCKWGITHTVEGNTVLICRTEKFGNPNDQLWKLIMESKLPVYCHMMTERSWNTYYHMNLENGLLWGFSDMDEHELGLICFVVDDYEVRKTRDICIPLISADGMKDMPDEIHLCKVMDTTVDNAVRLLIDRVCGNYPDIIPTSFVKAVVDYYAGK